MGTKEKLEHVKEIFALNFLRATELSTAHGLQFKYKSYSSEDISFGENEMPVKGWIIDIFVHELGYGEKAIQQFRYQKPEGIDHKNVEYHAILETMCQMTQGCLVFWYNTAKYINRDKDIQKEIKDGN